METTIVYWGIYWGNIGVMLDLGRLNSAASFGSFQPVDNQTPGAS